MRKRSKKQKVELLVKQPERREFGYMISESLSREQLGKFSSYIRGMIELSRERGGA